MLHSLIYKKNLTLCVTRIYHWSPLDWAFWSTSGVAQELSHWQSPQIFPQFCYLWSCTSQIWGATGQHIRSFVVFNLCQRHLYCGYRIQTFPLCWRVPMFQVHQAPVRVVSATKWAWPSLSLGWQVGDEIQRIQMHPHVIRFQFFKHKLYHQ